MKMTKTEGFYSHQYEAFDKTRDHRHLCLELVRDEDAPVFLRLMAWADLNGCPRPRYSSEDGSIIHIGHPPRPETGMGENIVMSYDGRTGDLHVGRGLGEGKRFPLSRLHRLSLVPFDLDGE